MRSADINNESKAITAGSKTSFLYSFSLLSKEKNDAINTVYAFCRRTDDIVDDETDSDNIKLEKLNKWKEEFTSSLSGNSTVSLLNKLNTVIKRFSIPLEPFYDLIKGMEMDLEYKTYNTFDELNVYCYRAASTVGLMCIEIFGYNNPKTKDFAVNLGIALQLTNILRDVKKDAENGRIYLPLEDLEKFSYTEQELISGKYNDRFRKLMEFEAGRAREYYLRANTHLSKEDKGLMFAARIMEKIYFRLLKKIEKNDYNVFDKPVKVSKVKKLLITFAIFAKYRFLYNSKDPRSVISNISPK